MCLKRNSKELVIRRNFLCPEYEGCLDQAARADHDLDCRGCALKGEKPMDADLPAASPAAGRMLRDCGLR
jgi:hypothetical protein